MPKRLDDNEIIHQLKDSLKNANFFKVEQIIKEHKLPENAKLRTEILHFACQYADVRSQTEKLKQACQNSVKLFVQNGCNINAVLQGFTPLQLVCKKGEADMCKVIIEFNPNVDVADSSGQTAMHLTCSLQCLELLLQKKCDVTLTTNQMQTKLHLICKEPSEVHYQMLHALMNSRSSYPDNKRMTIDPIDKRGNTPLHYLAQYVVQNDTRNHDQNYTFALQMTAVLIKNDADVSLSDMSQKNFKYYASKSVDLAVVLDNTRGCRVCECGLQ